jgi:hypothetical protein
MARISVRGWKRDSGEKTICEFEVKGAEADNEKNWKPYTPYIRRTTTGIELRIGPQGLTLGGDYQVILSFTDEDITRVFLEAHPELRTIFEPIFRKVVFVPRERTRRDDDDPVAAE